MGQQHPPGIAGRAHLTTRSCASRDTGGPIQGEIYPGRLRWDDVSKRIAADRLLPVVALAVVVLFLFAIQLLGSATNAAAPALRTAINRIVVGDLGALGLSWLGAYGLGNGSVVAALALSLFTAELLTVSQLFVMIAGSRLGAAAIVVFIGALDFFQKRRFTLQESVSMGVLTFLLTHSIYVPATVLGYLALPLVDRVGAGPPVSFATSPLAVFEPLTAAITAAVGPVATVVLAVGLLFGSLQLFDRLLGHVPTATLRDRFFSHLQHTWVSFFIGLLVTAVTTSVAFSLGVIVPLYNRGYVEREELIPYVLGANLGTIIDTVVVAVVLESGVGVSVVAVLLVAATLVTVLALSVHDAYSGLVIAADERILADRRLFAAFLGLLALAPGALVLGSLLLG
jgi:sodium-dependent phosphate cotransporter